jgi:hypothetical protein
MTGELKNQQAISLPAFSACVNGDIEDRISIRSDGAVSFGDGAVPVDVTLDRPAPGLIRNDGELLQIGKLFLSAALRAPVITRTVDYTVDVDADLIVGVDNTADLGDITITLPAAHSSGDMAIIHDVGGNADSGVNSVIVAPGAGDNINGSASSITLSEDYESLWLRSDGTDWYIVARALIGGGGGGPVALNDLTDVTISAPATGSMLYKSAGDWLNSTSLNWDEAGNALVVGDNSGSNRLITLSPTTVSIQRADRPFARFNIDPISGALRWRRDSDGANETSISHSVTSGDLTISDSVIGSRGFTAGAGFGVDIEAGGGNFSHSGATSAGQLTIGSRRSGDTMTRFAVLGDGQIRLGDGTAVPDWEISRTAVDVASLAAGDFIRCQQDPVDGDDLARKAYIDAVAYTIASGSSSFFAHTGAPTPNTTVFESRVDGDANARFEIRADGDHLWGPGSSGADVTLVRSSANTLLLGAGDTLQIQQDPVVSDDVARKQYVDDEAALRARTSVQQYVTASGITSITGLIQTVVCDATAGAQTINLPASPVGGSRVTITKRDASNNVTVSGNGNNIDGAASQVLSTQYSSITVEYSPDAGEWMIV